MDPQVMNQLFERLDVIAAKMGVLAGHLWEVLIRQSIVEGYSDLATAFALLCTVVVVCFYSKKTWKLGKEAREVGRYNSDGDGWYFLGIVLVIIAIGLGITAGNFGQDGLKELLNPEYYALQHLLTGLK